MGETSTNTAVWGMLAERWRKTIRAKALSARTERGYLYTARRWAEVLDEQGHHIELALYVPRRPRTRRGQRPKTERRGLRQLAEWHSPDSSTKSTLRESYRWMCVRCVPSRLVRRTSPGWRC